MNAYICNGGELEFLQEYIDYWARYESAYLVNIIFAETRGQAKSILLKSRENQSARAPAEFIDIRCRCIERNVKHPSGFAKDTDSLWELPQSQLMFKDRK